MNMKVTAGDGTVLVRNNYLGVQWSAAEACPEGFERLPSRVDQGGECVPVCTDLEDGTKQERGPDGFCISACEYIHDSQW